MRSPTGTHRPARRRTRPAQHPQPTLFDAADADELAAADEADELAAQADAEQLAETGAAARAAAAARADQTTTAHAQIDCRTLGAVERLAAELDCGRRRLSRMALLSAVAGHLMACAGTGAHTMALDDLAARVGINYDTMRLATAALEAAGWITATDRGRGPGGLSRPRLIELTDAAPVRSRHDREPFALVTSADAALIVAADARDERGRAISPVPVLAMHTAHLVACGGASGHTRPLGELAGWVGAGRRAAQRATGVLIDLGLLERIDRGPHRPAKYRRLVDPQPRRVVDPQPRRVVDPQPRRVVDPQPRRLRSLDLSIEREIERDLGDAPLPGPPADGGPASVEETATGGVDRASGIEAVAAARAALSSGPAEPDESHGESEGATA